MATQIFAHRHTADVIDKMEIIRSMLRALLHEISLRTQPVRIDPVKGIDFYENVARFERQLIETALEITNGRQSEAARLLNMRTSTLSSKIKQLNMRNK